MGCDSKRVKKSAWGKTRRGPNMRGCVDDMMIPTHPCQHLKNAATSFVAEPQQILENSGLN